MIKSKKLSKFNNISHGFFNKSGGVSKGIYKSLNCGVGSKDLVKNIDFNLDIVKKKIKCGKKSLVLLNQHHSKKIYFLNKIPKHKVNGDGMITKKKNIALGILTADCAPVFIYDKKLKIISAIHSGWKGAYKKIVINLVLKLKKIGSKSRNLIAVIGPCIGQKNYEVKKEFKNKFLRKSLKNTKFFIETKNKIYFDLSGFIKQQLIGCGIDQIEIIKKDTFDIKNNFFSSRYNTIKNYNDYGRNISIIMIK